MAESTAKATSVTSEAIMGGVGDPSTITPANRDVLSPALVSKLTIRPGRTQLRRYAQKPIKIPRPNGAPPWAARMSMIALAPVGAVPVVIRASSMGATMNPMPKATKNALTIQSHTTGNFTFSPQVWLVSQPPFVGLP